MGATRTTGIHASRGRNAAAPRKGAESRRIFRQVKTDQIWERLEPAGVARTLLFSDAPAGLRALLVIDDLTLGPAAGGVRTRAYPSFDHALEDCAELARAMTVKCSLAGLAAGGAKLVVIDHPGLDRQRAFVRLGELVDELGGLFRTAGDLGTTAADLAAMATTCRFVHLDEAGLASAVARGVLRCIEVCAEIRGVALTGLRVGVQGVGVIGEAVALTLAQAGARLVVADIDRERATGVARAVDAEVVDPRALLTAPVDVLAPCAVGGVIGRAEARALRAWAVCGAANNLLREASAARDLAERGVLLVPDPVASAGAVIHGISASVMGLPDPTALIDALGTTAREILQESRSTGEPTPSIAERRARLRIEQARAHRGRSVR